MRLFGVRGQMEIREQGLPAAQLPAFSASCGSLTFTTRSQAAKMVRGRVCAMTAPRRLVVRIVEAR